MRARHIQPTLQSRVLDFFRASWLNNRYAPSHLDVSTKKFVLLAGSIKKLSHDSFSRVVGLLRYSLLSLVMTATILLKIQYFLL